MTFLKIAFLIANFVKCVPQICLLRCVNTISVLKLLNLKIPFVIN